MEMGTRVQGDEPHERLTVPITETEGALWRRLRTCGLNDGTASTTGVRKRNGERTRANYGQTAAAMALGVELLLHALKPVHTRPRPIGRVGRLVYQFCHVLQRWQD